MLCFLLMPRRGTHSDDYALLLLMPWRFGHSLIFLLNTLAISVYLALTMT